jgi:hypothetical protein
LVIQISIEEKIIAKNTKSSDKIKNKNKIDEKKFAKFGQEIS